MLKDLVSFQTVPRSGKEGLVFWVTFLVLWGDWGLQCKKSLVALYIQDSSAGSVCYMVWLHKFNKTAKSLRTYSKTSLFRLSFSSKYDRLCHAHINAHSAIWIELSNWRVTPLHAMKSLRTPDILFTHVGGTRLSQGPWFGFPQKMSCTIWAIKLPNKTNPRTYSHSQES